MSDMDGTNSIRQNSPNTISINMLNGFIIGLNPAKLQMSNAIRISIIIALGNTPSQNSLREERPLKSNVRTKNNLKA